MRNIGILAVVSAMATFAVAQTPTIDQSLEAKQPQSVEISPDGRSVAYTVQYTNWDENSFDEQIWIAKTASGEKYPLTGGKKSSQSPQWSYDSRRIAFKSDRDGKSQIYVIAPAGGEAATTVTSASVQAAAVMRRSSGRAEDDEYDTRPRCAMPVFPPCSRPHSGQASKVTTRRVSLERAASGSTSVRNASRSASSSRVFTAMR